MLIAPFRGIYVNSSVPCNIRTLNYFEADTLHHLGCKLRVYPSLLYLCEMYDTTVCIHVLGGGVC